MVASDQQASQTRSKLSTVWQHLRARLAPHNSSQKHHRAVLSLCLRFEYSYRALPWLNETFFTNTKTLPRSPRVILVSCANHQLFAVHIKQHTHLIQVRCQEPRAAGSTLRNRKRQVRLLLQ